jgi:hypothetical protein
VSACPDVLSLHAPGKGGSEGEGGGREEEDEILARWSLVSLLFDAKVSHHRCCYLNVIAPLCRRLVGDKEVVVHLLTPLVLSLSLQDGQLGVLCTIHTLPSLFSDFPDTVITRGLWEREVDVHTHDWVSESESVLSVGDD